MTWAGRKWTIIHWYRGIDRFRAIRLLLIFGFILWFFIPPLTFLSPGIPLPHWLLPPRIILLHLLRQMAPSLVEFADLALYSVLPLSFFLGWRMISRTNILEHPVRHRIYNCIEENPGIHFTALLQASGLNRGTQRYHLAVLVWGGKVTSVLDEGYTRYFLNNGRYSRTEQKVLSHMRHATDQRILLLLIESGFMSRRELARALTLSLSTISWHISRLFRDNIVTIQKSGRQAMYMLAPEARMIVIRECPSSIILSPSQTLDQFYPGSPDREL